MTGKEIEWMLDRRLQGFPPSQGLITGLERVWCRWTWHLAELLSTLDPQLSCLDRIALNCFCGFGDSGDWFMGNTST